MRWLAGLLLACVLAAAVARPGPDSNYNVNIASTGGCSAATTFLARTSGTSGTEQTAYTNMICGMIADGVGCSAWSGSSGNLDRLYIWVTNSTTTALLDLCGGTSLTSNGSMTFSADAGYTGDGSTGYLDTSFIPSSAGGNCTQNSCSLGSYHISTTGAGGAAADFGAAETAAVHDTSFRPDNGSTSAIFNINNDNANSMSADHMGVNEQGDWILTRTGASTVALYLNGNTTSLTINPPGAATSTTMPTFSIWFFAINYNGSPLIPTASTLGAGFIGGGLTSTQMAHIDTRLNNYMTAFGKNVH